MNVVGSVVQLSDKDTRPDVALARVFNPQIIADQSQQIRDLEERIARYEKPIEVRVAFVKWLCRDAYRLFVELPGEKSFLVASAFDEPDKYGELFSRFLISALLGGELLEHLRTPDGGEPAVSLELERLLR